MTTRGARAGSTRLQELDHRMTPMGELTLRRRRDPLSGVDLFEVKLGDEYLMSSLFTVAEEELAHLALRELDGPAPRARGGSRHSLDVAVGGLGLGYTARAVLEHPEVTSLIVVDAMEAVIEWHRDGLVPVGPVLTADPRCRLQLGDFFAMVAGTGLDPEHPGRRFDAVVLDIDHSPRHVLNPTHADFYTASGLARLADLLRPGGVFTLWSNDPPDEPFLDLLRGVFTTARAEVVRFANPLQGRESTNTVYVARTASVPHLS